MIVFAALWLQVAVELLDWMRSGARGPMVTPEKHTQQLVAF